jgi:putative glycosyltransferase (TIGR04372 family)
MSRDAEIAELSATIRDNPDDIAARNRLGEILLPAVISGWPTEEHALNTEYYRQFLNQVALPLLEVLRPVRTLATADFIFRIVGALHWLGEHPKAEQYVLEALSIREEIARAHPCFEKGLRFLQSRTGIRTQFGHLIVEPDIFIRTGKLGWREEIKPLLLMPDKKCANPALLRYWQKDICVVSDPYLCEQLGPISDSLEHNSFWLDVPHVGVRYGHSGIIAAIRQWEKECRPAVLSLDPRHRTDGWKILHNMGVPNDAWFVVAHVRQSAVNSIDSVSQRNSDVRTYMDAYSEITRRGGYVFRIGNPSMPAIEPTDRVIDLAHNTTLPSWFDLFLVAEAKFFLGSASGPCSLAATFGTPLVMSNITANCFPVSDKDIFLPKLLREKTTKRLLTFRETFVPHLQYLFNGKIFDELGLEAVDNQPDELRNATIEMIERIEGTAVYTDNDKYLQSRFNALASTLEGYPLTCGLARDFARRYQDLILG